MKQSPRDFYQTQIEEYTQLHQKLKKQLVLSSVFRLVVFLAICVGVYLTFGNTKLVLAILAVGIGVFVLLLTRHSKLQYDRDLKSAMLQQNFTEIESLDRNFDMLYDDGKTFVNSQHPYSQDIDLFGYASFYHYINRTSLTMGAKALAALLTENSIDRIPEKQEAVKELSKLARWRQSFSAIASLVKTEASSALVIRWLQGYKPFVPKFSKVLSVVFSVISVVLFGLYFFGNMSGYLLFGWFLLGLFISGSYLKKVSQLSRHTSKIQSTFEQFHKLILEIETQKFSSSLLSEKKALIVTSKEKASETLKKFAKHLDALDQRNNMLVGVLLNGFMLRDLAIASKIENWIENHSGEVEAWFNTITFFDAYNSLGNYAFNHPAQVFPKITKDKTVLQVEGGGHPLLNPETMVPNNLTINEQEFFIVTGANMAGKSTFLRTVSLHIVMANTGLPICASAAVYSPVKLITSMRTTDSLTNDESYFFSELKRLRFIVSKIKEDRYFIILDEILKGTNSTDKAIGSRKFVEKLVAGNSTGIIATHDLSLCEVSKELPQVKNYYFDAQIVNDELFFDYTFKPGICQNMNASFLLKKMNIVD
ncbi:MutS-related protein [Marinirhabdus gelatinilytica]|uniref:MutS-like protein n=1 Tax=Marinirhabdus gelatinilytica TaxID=1703343 RepID=A0A370QKJ4_9FLAO|nr:DNA mismatch repair protein MutS [Marinirhabdus gelatinilytica]RDK88895.1 MutS-like protein [Marinirhabdus gelatinilytica]